MIRRTGVLGGLAMGLSLGLGLLLAGPAQAATTGTIYVSDDFDKALSDTRATGHYEVQGAGLHVYTAGNTSTDKVAEYIATNTALAQVGTPSLAYHDTGSDLKDPGYQLVVDLDDDGHNDGILVGEAIYNGNWWLGDHRDFKASVDIRAAAPKEPGGGGAENGTLQQWSSKFPNAVVTAFGFSLGSGVLGDGVIDSMSFAGTIYTFAVPVVLTSKDECKDGGWARSTHPAYRNQGACVSHFATSTANGPARVGTATATTTTTTTAVTQSSSSALTGTSTSPATATIGLARNPVILKKMI
jgi:hypothetical protein